jgi:GNAT superfamily N-acetyltransferase
MPAALDIRDYRRADEAAVWELHVAASTAVDAFADPDCCEAGVETDPAAHAAASRRLASEGVFLVGELADAAAADATDTEASDTAEPGTDATADGTVVAMGALDPIEGAAVELTRMRVAPDHWRRGFGQAMLAALERRATALGASTVELETLARQRAARGLYEANGYVETGRQTVDEFDVRHYEKSL